MVYRSAGYPFRERPALAAAFAVLAIVGTTNAIAVSRSLVSPYLWMKDLRQDWLQARALVSGLPSYERLGLLADRFIGPQHPPEFPMATPHPPFAAAVCLPLGLVPYSTATVVWTGSQVLALILSTWFLYGRWVGKKNRRLAEGAALSLFAMAYPPVMEDMVLGQFSIFITVLLLAAWVSLRSRRDMLGGIWLGSALALKLTGWPLVCWLLLERRWRAACSAGAIVAAFHLFALPVVGTDGMARYYSEVGPQAAAIYGAYERNFSVGALAARIFSGMRSSALVGFSSLPLIDAPNLVNAATGVFLALLLLGAALGARRAIGSAERRFDAGFAIFTCITIVANPVAWNSYLVLAAIPLWVIARESARSDGWYPPVLALIGGIGVVLPAQVLHELVGAVTTREQIPVGLSFVSMVPLLAVVFLAAAVSDLCARKPEEVPEQFPTLSL